jgi:hypothetical protein
MWTSFDDIFHHYWTPQRSQKQLTPTELSPECMEQSSSDQIVDTGQGHSLAEDPTLSGCQDRATPTPRKVAHLGSNLTEVSSLDGGTQHNGDHCFLRGEDLSTWILVATHLFQRLLLFVFVQHIILYFFVIVGSTLLGLSEALHIL